MTVTNIKDNIALYRFVNFFDLYNLLKYGKLRIPKLNVMEDKNEGLGAILLVHDQEVARTMMKLEQDFDSYHKAILHNNYISCWTKEPELIAMWSLYSRDQMAVRIKTSSVKMMNCLNKYYEANIWSPDDSLIGSGKLMTWNYSLVEVEYVDFFKLKSDIDNKYTDFESFTKEKAKTVPDYYISKNGFQSDYLKFCEQKTIPNDGLILKDRAYTYENEVRGIIRCGIRNDLKHAEWLKEENIMRSVFKSAKEGVLPNSIHLDVDDNFVEEICFDPRCPNWKKEVYLDIIDRYYAGITESKSFGYYLDSGLF
jgi:hypothetical protein